MRHAAELLFRLLCMIELAKSMNINHDDAKEDRYNHAWRIPDLKGTGLVVLDGDIVAPWEDDRETYMRKGLKFDSFFDRMLKWPDGVISYWFDPVLPSRHRRIIQDAMKHWEENTCLKFVPANPYQFTFYVNFRSDRDGCYSLLGRFLFGQDINLGDGCVRHRTAIHEIGHAIGFYHEQSRRDRDDFIKIIWKNMEESESRQFRKASDDPKGVPYDFSSVMQYGESAFTSDIEKNTIVTLNPFMQLSLGGEELSFRDRKLANAMYSCDQNCRNRGELKCENEGFMFQRHGQNGNCSCMCPPNTSGARCEILLDRSYYEYPKCGGNITSEGTIQTPNAPKTMYEDGGCIFWIQAPQGKHVQIEFSLFKYENRRRSVKIPKSELKCRGERVEIRTSSLFEGKMYCGNDLEGGNITSTTGNMIIIATPKYSGSPGGFRGTVRFVDVQKKRASGRLGNGFS